MDVFLIVDGEARLLPELPQGLPEHGFYWLDATHDEVRADPEGWRDRVQRVTGTHIYDPHLTDAVNLRHPSYFDAAQAYHMLVFRKRQCTGLPVVANHSSICTSSSVKGRRLSTISTRPASCCRLRT